MKIMAIGKYENIPRAMRRSKAFKSLTSDAKEILNVMVKFGGNVFSDMEIEVACRLAGIVIDDENSN